MLHELGLILSLLLAFCLLILALGWLQTAPPNLSARAAYLPLGLGLMLCLWGYAAFPATEAAQISRFLPPIIGLEASLQWGLKAQTQLPIAETDLPPLTWLTETREGRKPIKKPIVLFQAPEQAGVRRQGVQHSFQHRFGWKNAWTAAFQPRVIIVHSTEGDNEAHAYQIFNRNAQDQYQGGVWTHFSVDPEGQIYQYGPLNRISKGQAGLDNLAVGIEIIGNASLWDEKHKQTKTGSIISRWQQGDSAQLQAVQDLITTLQSQYQIPLKHVYSHEDLGHIGTRRNSFPDYHWLRLQIRDRVYLNLVPTLDQDLQAKRWYAFLEPYDRYDPGHDVMQVLYQQLSKH